MKKEELLKIVEKNKETIPERITNEGWKVRYDKQSDMIFIGGKFPEGSFYAYVADGVMLRIDKDAVLHGYAIENASYFINKNPEIGFVFYPLVHPVRARILFYVIRSVFNLSDMIRISSLKNYVDRSVGYAG